MAKSIEDKRAYNRERQARLRAEKKASVTPPIEEEDTLTVDVVGDETPVPQASFKDRILGMFERPAQQTKKPGRTKKTNLLTTALPTIVSAFIATYSRNLVKDPYKPCAPSQDEMSAMLAPLFEILGREVQVTGKASQNTIDLINSLICASMYGLRAYQTYVRIKEDHATANGHRKDESVRATHIHDSGTQHSENGASIQGDATRSFVDARTGDTTSESRDADIISDMFRRDIEGRKRLGLLSGTV